MNMANRTAAFLTRLRTDYWAIPVLLLWGAALLGLGLVRLDPYGIDETAARSLLLIWSIGERIASTAFVLGLPDFRALLQIPLGAYWPGSMMAAKVHILLVTAGAATLLYRWSQRAYGNESALIATGLLLIAPATVIQADVLGAGPYLLLAFGVGLWLDGKYRSVQRPLGGWYFLQLLWVMVAVSIHPAALAYPLALLWEWKRQPLDQRQQRHMYLGVSAAVIFTLVLRVGWPGLDWFANPLPALFQSVLGREPSGEILPWAIALLLLGTLLYLLIAERRAFSQQLMHRMLLTGLVIGAVCADGAWAMLALAIALYLGTPRLIALNGALRGSGFLGQRGLVMIAIFVACTLFMQVLKGHRYALAQNQMPPVDQLILAFSAEIDNANDSGNDPGNDLGNDPGNAPGQAIVTMTQWPGKTMLATRRAALPLPPPFADSETLLRNISGAHYLVFDPNDARNQELTARVAELTGVTETLLLETGGVAIRFRQPPGTEAQ
jgi:hypothetical protein